MLQPLNVLLQQQQLVRAQAKLQGSLVRGEEGHARKSVDPPLTVPYPPPPSEFPLNPTCSLPPLPAPPPLSYLPVVLGAELHLHAQLAALLL